MTAMQYYNNLIVSHVTPELIHSVLYNITSLKNAKEKAFSFINTSEKESPPPPRTPIYKYVGRPKNPKTSENLYLRVLFYVS